MMLGKNTTFLVLGLCLAAWPVSVVRGAYSYQKYRRHPTRGLRLNYFHLEMTGLVQRMTRTRCSSKCMSDFECLAFSLETFEQHAVCRLGRNPMAREVADQSVVYSKKIAPAVDSNGMIYPPDGNSYKRFDTVASSPSSARGTCENNGMTLPIPYQNDFVQMQLEEMLVKAEDTAYLDITGYLAGAGSPPERIFNTSAGVTFEATQMNSDDAQRWQTGQPDAAANSSAAAVVMTFAGWDDVRADTTVNVVICVGLGLGYKYEGTGQWFRMSRNTFIVQSAAVARCMAEGAHLALPYGPLALPDVLRKYRGLAEGYYWVDGYKTSTQRTTWHFYDGSIASDWNLAWSPPNPENTYGDDCLLVISTSARTLGDAKCNELLPFLCQRSFP